MRLLLAALFFMGLQPVFANINSPAVQLVSVYNQVQKNVTRKTGHYQPGATHQILHAGYAPATDSTDFVHLKRKARLAKWLGIGSLISVFIPYVGIVALPAAILGLILAGQVKKEAEDKGILRDASIGKWTSLATLILFVVAIIVVLAVIAAFAGWR